MVLSSEPASAVKTITPTASPVMWKLSITNQMRSASQAHIIVVSP
jgi:hypothetical protein